MKFPGDPCDPFDDLCIEDYGCDVDDGISDANPEFRCRIQFTSETSDGSYGQGCALSQQCQEGLKCEPWAKFPDGDCDPPAAMKCCMMMCAYEEICGDGADCSVTWWPADLEDYLDDYTGIGVCSAP